MTPTASPALEPRSHTLRPPRPVVGFAGSHPRGYVDPPHTHDRAQFSYRTVGVAAVRTPGRSIILPPGRGVWIPAGVPHEVSCRGRAAYNALYAATSATPRLPSVKVIEISPLLHALFETFLTFPNEYEEDGRQGVIVRLILDEIAEAPDLGEEPPRLPVEPRLRRVCEALRAAPDDPRDIDAWAAVAGMSRRSFTRAFREETGVPFAAWRSRLRLTEALARLEAGATVTEVARALGYSAVGAFSTAFARVHGRSPGQVRRNA